MRYCRLQRNYIDLSFSIGKNKEIKKNEEIKKMSKPSPSYHKIVASTWQQEEDDTILQKTAQLLPTGSHSISS